VAKGVLVTKGELTACLKKHEGWLLNKAETQLTKKFPVESYINGLVFIARIAVHAEILRHHPVIEYTHDTVKIKLTTREFKGITKVDLRLLERIEMLYERV